MNDVGNRWCSKGFLSLGLPQQVIDKIERLARQRRVHGAGSFCYVPVGVMAGGVSLEFVVCFFDKAMNQRNIQARPGDVSICLREEWNEHDNPIEGEAAGDGQHRWGGASK